MSDELKKAQARVTELERELDFMREQGRAKDFVITSLVAQLNGQPMPAELPDFIKNLTPPPSDQCVGGEA